MSALVTIGEAVGVLLTLTQASAHFAAAAARVSAAISRAQAEGRDTLTAEEWAAILGEDDAARAQLEAAIAQAKGA